MFLYVIFLIYDMYIKRLFHIYVPLAGLANTCTVCLNEWNIDTTLLLTKYICILETD